MDIYSWSYLVALLGTIAAVLKWGHRARIMGVSLMLAAWILTMLVKPQFAIAPPLSFATFDFIGVILFCTIGGYYDRSWALWVGGFHVAMLFTHFAFATLLIHNQFLYLSILAALSYASLAMIAVPLIWNKVLGRESRDLDYLPHVHLGYWHPLFGRSKKKAAK